MRNKDVDIYLDCFMKSSKKLLIDNRIKEKRIIEEIDVEIKRNLAKKRVDNFSKKKKPSEKVDPETTFKKVFGKLISQ